MNSVSSSEMLREIGGFVLTFELDRVHFRAQGKRQSVPRGGVDVRERALAELRVQTSDGTKKSFLIDAERSQRRDDLEAVDGVKHVAHVGRTPADVSRGYDCAQIELDGPGDRQLEQLNEARCDKASRRVLYTLQRLIECR
jgi:hypothetical protein